MKNNDGDNDGCTALRGCGLTRHLDIRVNIPAGKSVQEYLPPIPLCGDEYLLSVSESIDEA
ncbi:hypothetical protein [Noviherbaspirillum sp. Root189]|uniref:hypothetical protein n=1 Tax=Noviherbaspirillum sp. Root189 TaxID=1736487 RepID=UPI0012E3828F|nr:hypothetical protein [Noviherbaspirillum sp. Root189]